MSNEFLSTGQAAAICAVSPDTVLKWIRSGVLPAVRTAGGHHRIDRRDLDRVLRPSASKPVEKAFGRSAGTQKHFQYCWEYYGRQGGMQAGCRDCAVFLMRAQRCYEVVKLAPESGLSRTYCKDRCEDCDYYRLVRTQRTNVLVVSDDPVLTAALRTEVGMVPFNLEFSDCEYACSALIHRFRPDFAVVDCSMGPRQSRDILRHLAADPRIPFVRLILAVGNEELPDVCDHEVFARLDRPFCVEDITACIAGTTCEGAELVE